VKAAMTVDLITTQIDASPKAGACAASMTAHLGRHGVIAESRVERATVASEHEALATRIEGGAYNLLVMGAYSHSRWLEFLLGGPTLSALISSDIPVLVSH